MLNISLLSKDALDKHWNKFSSLLEKGLSKCENELNIHQLRLLITQGLAHIVLGVDDEGTIKGAIAFEIVNYPNYRVANIISFGGINLLATEEDLEQVKKGLRLAGILKIQGWCKPAQARLFKSKFGFETPYTMVRLDIQEG